MIFFLNGVKARFAQPDFFYYTLVVLKIDTSFHNAPLCSVRYCLLPFLNN